MASVLAASGEHPAAGPCGNFSQTSAAEEREERVCRRHLRAETPLVSDSILGRVCELRDFARVFTLQLGWLRFQARFAGWL